MNLKVSPEAVKWFERSIGIPADQKGAGIRFKSKIYGSSPINESFALALQVEEAQDPIASYQEGEDGLLFFVESRDAWFFDGHDLLVEYDPDRDEPSYVYLKDGQAIRN